MLLHAPKCNASRVARVVLEVDRPATVGIGHLGRKRRVKRSLKLRLDDILVRLVASDAKAIAIFQLCGATSSRVMERELASIAITARRE